MSQMTTYQNYIGGQWIDSVSGETYTISNPAHKSKILGAFQRSVHEDAVSAIEAARKAHPGWSSTPAPQRAAILYRAIALMDERGEQLARSITIEEGKPNADAQCAVTRATNVTHHASGARRRRCGAPR